MKIKLKIVNGKFVKGLIDENRNTVIPFEYDSIRYINDFLDYKGDNNVRTKHAFYICKKDGKEALYDQDGELIIGLDQNMRFDDILDVRKNKYGEDDFYFEATKDGKVGIVKVEHTLDDYGQPVPSYSIAYDFGKAKYVGRSVLGIRLEKYEDEEDAMTSKTGFLNADGTNTTIEPVFSPDFSSFDIARSEEFPYTDSKELGLFVYGDIVKERGRDRLKYGFLQRVDDEFVELFPPKYGNIYYDSDRQVFILNCGDAVTNYKSQAKLVGFAYNTKGKRPSVKPTYSLDLGYKYEFLNTRSTDGNVSFVKLQNRGKYGLSYFSKPIEVCEDNIQDMEFTENDYSAGNAIPCECDDIRVDENGLFFVIKNGLISIVTISRSKENQNKYVAEYILSDYVSIDNLEINKTDKKYYLCKKVNNKYDCCTILTTKSQDGQDSYECTKMVDDVDHIEIIDNTFIKTIKDGSVEVLDIRTGAKIDGVKNIEYSKNQGILGAILIYRDNGTIFCSAKRVNFEGGIIIQDPGVGASEIEVDFYPEFSKAVVTIGNESKLYTMTQKPCELTEGKPIISFERVYLNNYLNRYLYGELVNGEIITKVVDTVVDDYSFEMDEEVVYEGQFELVEKVSHNLVFKRLNKNTGKYEYGVYDSETESMVIDFEYDFIEYDLYDEAFICKKGNVKVRLDSDGFEKLRGVSDDELNAGGRMRERY